jgi:hypothetical protein
MVQPLDPLSTPDLRHSSATTLLGLVRLFTISHLMEERDHLARLSFMEDPSQPALQRRAQEVIVAVERSVVDVCRRLANTADIHDPEAVVSIQLTS